MGKTVDQWEWTSLMNLSEKHYREQMDRLTRCIERIRQWEEREEDASYKALTCTRDKEYLMKDRNDASKSKQQCIQDALEILTEEIPKSIDLLQSALCKGLKDNG